MNNDLKIMFREGTLEQLAELEEALLHLEKNLNNSVEINRIFRIMHTIKGSAGMAGFDDIAQFAHQLETEFDSIRHGTVTLSPQLVNLSLIACDQILAMINAYFGGPPADPVAAQNIIENIRQISKSNSLASTQDTKRQNLIDLVTRLPEILTKSEDLLEVVNTLQQILILARQLGICSLVEFLGDIFQDLKLINSQNLQLTPEAKSTALEVAHEAIHILSDALNPQINNLDPAVIMASLERPLNIKKKWKQISSACLTQTNNNQHDTSHVFRIIIHTHKMSNPYYKTLLDQLQKVGEVLATPENYSIYQDKNSETTEATA